MATELSTVVVLFALEREAAPFRRAARDLKRVSIHVSGIGRSRALLQFHLDDCLRMRQRMNHFYPDLHGFP
jgi:hypothetical protein